MSARFSHGLGRGRAASAFTLLEVVLAAGLLAFTAVGLVALLGAATRGTGDMGARRRALGLADAVAAELCRIRDSFPAGNRLSRLAALVPPENSGVALYLVADRDGLQVIRESEAASDNRGIPLAERYYLIEVRQQAGQFAYNEGSGVLALSAVIQWPYQLRTGPGATDATGSDARRRPRVLVNLGVTS